MLSALIRVSWDDFARKKALGANDRQRYVMSHASSGFCGKKVTA
jgi:hypothetical protein